MARQVSRGVSIAPGGAKLVHAQLMRPIGRSRNVVRMLAATLVPEPWTARSLRQTLQVESSNLLC